MSEWGKGWRDYRPPATPRSAQEPRKAAGPAQATPAAKTLAKALLEALEQQFLGHMRLLGLPEPIQQHRFDPARRWRFDFAWPDLMLAAEVQGGEFSQGRHNRGAGMAADAEKYNAAQLAGWKVLLYTGSQVRDGSAALALQEAIRRLTP